MSRRNRKKQTYEAPKVIGSRKMSRVRIQVYVDTFEAIDQLTREAEEEGDE